MVIGYNNKVANSHEHSSKWSINSLQSWGRQSVHYCLVLNCTALLSKQDQLTNSWKWISKCYGFNHLNRECHMAVSKKEHVPLKFIELAEASLSISECNRFGILLRVISDVLFILHPTAFQVSLPNKLQRRKSINNLLIHCAYYEKHIQQGYTNPRYQVAMATKLYMVTPNICGSILAPRILGWFQDFSKINTHPWHIIYIQNGITYPE